MRRLFSCLVALSLPLALAAEEGPGCASRMWRMRGEPPGAWLTRGYEDPFMTGPGGTRLHHGAHHPRFLIEHPAGGAPDLPEGSRIRLVSKVGDLARVVGWGRVYGKWIRDDTGADRWGRYAVVEVVCQGRRPVDDDRRIAELVMRDRWIRHTRFVEPISSGP